MANHKKQFCPRGHDTKVVGRTPRNGCRQCVNEKSREWYALNTGKAKLSIKKWACANKDRTRDNELRRTYGITLEDYWRMYKEQNGLCAICHERKDLVVDHDHKTGEVRGLLCGSCNRGIGYLKDKPDNLERAIRYLNHTFSPVLVHSV